MIHILLLSKNEDCVCILHLVLWFDSFFWVTVFVLVMGENESMRTFFFFFFNDPSNDSNPLIVQKRGLYLSPSPGSMIRFLFISNSLCLSIGRKRERASFFFFFYHPTNDSNPLSVQKRGIHPLLQPLLPWKPEWWIFLTEPELVSTLGGVACDYPAVPCSSGLSWPACS